MITVAVEPRRYLCRKYYGNDVWLTLGNCALLTDGCVPRDNLTTVGLPVVEQRSSIKNMHFGCDVSDYWFLFLRLWFVEFGNFESSKRILSYLIGTGFPGSRPPVWPQSRWVWWTCLPCSSDTLAWHGRNWLTGRQTHSNTCPRIRPWSLHEPELD